MIGKVKTGITLLLIVSAAVVIAISQPPSSIVAQTSNPSCLTGSRNPRVERGLISTGELVGLSRDFFRSDTGKCVVGSGAQLLTLTMPTYADLKTTYFDQSKFGSRVTEGTSSYLPSGISQDSVYYYPGERRVIETPSGSGNYTPSGGPRVAVFFIDGSLQIDRDIVYPSPGDDRGGLVFIVQGKIDINKDVKRIDAVLVSAGTICTAYVESGGARGCPQKSSLAVQQLIVNGSLISLDPTKSIVFARSFADNRQPAEKIVWQAKYLVILKDMLSTEITHWSEIQ